MTEAELSDIVTEALDVAGWRWQHQRPARTSKGWRTPIRGSAGWPDIFAVRNGKALALELKAERGTVHVDQAEWVRQLAEVPGIEALVVRPVNLDALLAVILSKPTKRTARR